MTGCAVGPRSGSLPTVSSSSGDMPGGSWEPATVSSPKPEHSELDNGWMVAKAGPAIAIINAITNATVTGKTMRLISATSFLRKARTNLSIICTHRLPRRFEYDKTTRLLPRISLPRTPVNRGDALKPHVGDRGVDYAIKGKAQ